MYRGNLSEDEYGTQRFLADLLFESVIVEIDPDTNDLYSIVQITMVSPVSSINAASLTGS